MQMTLSNFLFSSRANCQDGHFEVQIFASHRVVEVKFHGIVCKRSRDTLEDVPGAIAQAHSLTKADFKPFGEGLAADCDHRIGVKLAIGILGFGNYLKRVAQFGAGQWLFEPGDDVAVTMQVFQQVLFNFFAIHIDIVRNLNDVIVLDSIQCFFFHFSPFSRRERPPAPHDYNRL